MGERASRSKLIVLLLSLFLITCCIPTFVSANGFNKIKTIDKRTSETIYSNNDFFPLVINSYPVDQEPNSIDIALKPSAKVTPDYFNWMDYEGQDWTTPIRSQGWCGSCWAFAALGIIESMIEIREGAPNLNPDLSEQYLLTYLPKAGSCDGGTCSNALELIADTSLDGDFQNGVILEKYLEYQKNDTIDMKEKYENWQDNIVPIASFGKWLSDPEDREEIKTQIMTNGPVAAALKVIPEFTKWLMVHHSPNDYFPYPGVVQGTNHEVIIVGWKDSQSIDNGGYWICKNSWGKGFGYNGYFNIEYGSLNIDNSKIVFVDYDPDSYDWAPVTNANGLYYASVGEEITFDASKSFDADGSILEYKWDFGDGTFSSEKITTHVFNEKGIFSITLETIDNNGSVGFDNTWAFIDVVNNEPKKPSVTGPNSGLDRTWYDYSFSSIDPDGDDLYYYVDWGDGFIDEWVGPYKSGEEVQISHLWYFKDLYKIKVKVKDVYGNESSWGTLNVGIPDYKPYVDSSFIKYLFNFLGYNSLLAQLLEKIFKF